MVASEDIQVELVRSGGFAGISRQASVDTADLPPGEAAQVTALVDDLDLAGLGQRAGQPGQGADRYQYDLTIRRGRSRHEFSLPESSVPPDLKPLLAWLLDRSAPA